MNEGFVTWAMFAEYAQFTFLVYVFVEFTKELPIVSKIRTKYYSAFIAFVMLMLVNVQANTFELWDIML